MILLAYLLLKLWNGVHQVALATPRTPQRNAWRNAGATPHALEIPSRRP